MFSLNSIQKYVFAIISQILKRPQKIVTASGGGGTERKNP